MAHQFFIDKRPHKGLNYKKYIQHVIKEVADTNLDALDDLEKEHYEFKKLNLQRSSRIDRAYAVSQELESVLKKIKDKQLWMVITEGWCGDSAQILPQIAKIAEVNPNIELRILLRDSNLDIMDMYLTNGTRSIPKLVIFDEAGNELLTWGPRPKVLLDLVNEWKSQGIVKPELYEKLHLWYGRNRGKEIENEFIKILSF